MRPAISWTRRGIFHSTSLRWVKLDQLDLQLPGGLQPRRVVLRSVSSSRPRAVALQLLAGLDLGAPERVVARVAKFEKPAAVPMAMPAISPIAQPVRQCSVALMATPSEASWPWS